MYIKTPQEENTNMHKLRKVRYNKENDEYMHSNYIYVCSDTGTNFILT